jgi:hypothetical protein
MLAKASWPARQMAQIAQFMLQGSEAGEEWMNVSIG